MDGGLERDASHPCIVGLGAVQRILGRARTSRTAPPERHYVQGLYHLTKTLDPRRPVIGNDGWEASPPTSSGSTTTTTTAHRLPLGMRDERSVPRLLERERPGGLPAARGRRRTPASRSCSPNSAGSRSRTTGRTPGVTAAPTRRRAGVTRYCRLLGTVHARSLLAGFCYTQLTDTYQEANGLLYADRTPKFPLSEMARITRGPGSGALGGGNRPVS